MDRSNKYYNIIENMVKNHRKFLGYEAILEDIIDDVYSHSETIISTIDNQDVINAYLQKVVSTSIITVPKKLNFHNELKHSRITAASDISSYGKNLNKTETVNISQPVSSQIIQEETYTQTNNPVIEQNSLDNLIPQGIPEKKADPNLVDKMINSIDTDSVMEISSTDISDSSMHTEDLSDINNIEDFDIEDLPLEQEPVEEVKEEESISETEVDDNIQESLEVEDLSLEQEVFEDSQDTDLGFDSEIEEIAEAEDLPLEQEPVEEEESISETEVDDNIQESLEVEDLPLEQESVEDIENTDLGFENEIQEIGFEDSLENSDDIQDFSIEDTESENLSISSDEQEELIEESIDTDILELNDNIDIQSVSENEIAEPDNSDLEQKKNIEFKAVDYSVFNYTPREADSYLDEKIIADKLVDLNKNKPELNILKVYDLKYKKNLTIDSIAEQLNIDTQTVVTALDEMIKLV